MSFYRMEKLPGKVRSRFDERVELDRGETLVALHAPSLFGAGKTGTAFTSKRIVRYSDQGSDSHPYSETAFASYRSNPFGYCELIVHGLDGAIEKFNLQTTDVTTVEALIVTIQNAAVPGKWGLRGLSNEGKPVDVSVVYAPTIDPRCPNCGADCASLNQRRLSTPLGVGLVYFCPHCQKILGFSHTQGHMMR